MTSNLKSKASGNPDLDAVFDPYVQGTQPANTGFIVGGVDIATRYAPIVFGTAAAATGFLTAQAGHADLNTLFAAFGTAHYGLPIDGDLFVATATTAGSSSSATLNFNTNNSTWSVTDPNHGGTVTPLASGSIPSGATKVRLTWTLLSGTAATLTNPASTFTALTGTTLTATATNTVIGGGQPAILSTYNIKIEYQNAGGTTISTSNVTYRVNTNHT